MKADDYGVAGFFEDLPVLIFVLIGVFAIVTCGVWSANTLEDQRLHEKCMRLAERVVIDITLQIRDLAGENVVPSLNAISDLNLTRVVNGLPHDAHCSIAIVERYPNVRLLANLSYDVRTPPLHAFGASALINALDGSLRTVVVEVKTVVW